MNDNEIEADATARARRRLIKGVFGAPAALTLVSGSVYAASNQRCLVNAQNPAANPSTPAAATWFRVELWALANAGGSNNSSWVKGADLAALQASGTLPPYLANGSWQAVIVQSGSVFSVGQVLTTTPSTSNGTGNPPNTPQRSGQYVAVRVDSVGNIVGVQGVGTTGAAVSLVCWASFTGTPSP